MSHKGYNNILKSTFLFGFVQVFNILIKIVLNKIVALILGPTGMGIISLFQNSINLLVTGCGLGVSQSSVKDISEANKQNSVSLGKIIYRSKKLYTYIGILGFIVTICLSPLLSYLSFGDFSYTISYLFLSIVVFFTIISTAQKSILSGMRLLRSLAYCSIISSIFGLVFAIPFYFFFKDNGIVPSLIASAVSVFIVTYFYIKKINTDSYKINFISLIKESKSTIVMGVSLMVVSFIGFFFSFIVSVFIREYSSISLVGIYGAGVSIITGYFGIITTAMTTDYYPRICAVSNDNNVLQNEVNRQTEVGLILVYPLALIFILFSKSIILILYSNSFINVLDYTDYAIFGTIIIICSNSLGMILLAKQEAKIFLLSVIIQKITVLLIYILSFIFYGVKGLGIAYVIGALIHLGVMSVIMSKLYHIRINKRIYSLLIMIIISMCIAVIFKNINIIGLRYSLSIFLILVSLLYTYVYLRKKMDIDIIKFKRKNK